MAREANSERGLPSPEVRRQILQHAGIILHEARQLMEQLDRHESIYPRTACEHRPLLWATQERPDLETLSCALPADAEELGRNHALAA